MQKLRENFFWLKLVALIIDAQQQVNSFVKLLIEQKQIN
jgi:hypothetical protein